MVLGNTEGFQVRISEKIEKIRSPLGKPKQSGASTNSNNGLTMVWNKSEDSKGIYPCLGPPLLLASHIVLTPYRSNQLVIQDHGIILDPPFGNADVER